MGCINSTPQGYQSVDEFFQDIQIRNILNVRYWESHTASRFTQGEHSERYREIAKKLERLLEGTPRERRRYLRHNRDWDVVAAVE